MDQDGDGDRSEPSVSFVRLQFVKLEGALESAGACDLEELVCVECPTLIAESAEPQLDCLSSTPQEAS